VLQCVVVFCSVLQCVAVCCSVLQCVAVCCSVLQCVAVCCSVLQSVAVGCGVLQRASGDEFNVGCDTVSSRCSSVLQCIAIRCSGLRCVAMNSFTFNMGCDAVSSDATLVSFTCHSDSRGDFTRVEIEFACHWSFLKKNLPTLMRDSSMPASISYFILSVSVHPHTSISFALFFCCVLLWAQWGIEIFIVLNWCWFATYLCVYIYYFWQCCSQHYQKSHGTKWLLTSCVCLFNLRVGEWNFYWKLILGVLWIRVLFKTDSAYLKDTGVALFTLANPENCSPL